MTIRLAPLVVLLFFVGCGGEEVAEVPFPPDTFFFDSGGAHHIQGYGAWRVTASREGRFRAVHDVRGVETVYDEVLLAPSVREAFWRTVDRARLDAPRTAERPGVPDEVQLTFRLAKGAGDAIETTIWQNDARGDADLQPLLEELKVRIEDACGVRPVF